MVRVRKDGWVVPRHNAGMLRAVRGSLTLADMLVPKLRRHSRTASFLTDYGETMLLHDAQLVHASTEQWVLTGFEQSEGNPEHVVDYAQTWVLTECEGAEPEASRGPAHLR